MRWENLSIQTTYYHELGWRWLTGNCVDCRKAKTRCGAYGFGWNESVHGELISYALCRRVKPVKEGKWFATQLGYIVAKNFANGLEKLSSNGATSNKDFYMHEICFGVSLNIYSEGKTLVCMEKNNKHAR